VSTATELYHFTIDAALNSTVVPETFALYIDPASTGSPFNVSTTTTAGGENPSMPGSCQCDGSMGGNSVDVATGAYDQSVTDLSIPTYGPALASPAPTTASPPRARLQA
jgi:hypothetical protein